MGLPLICSGGCVVGSGCFFSWAVDEEVAILNAIVCLYVFVCVCLGLCTVLVCSGVVLEGGVCRIRVEQA